jgi:MoaA/NifB/PqqE/SkfB family radical SAM enzyme
MKLNKIRFLLTSACSARCAYCHNEGQSKEPALLQTKTIADILGRLKASGNLPDEIVLSGGEPTLHKQVGEIARLCKDAGCYVSMDTHAGHPRLLAKALPFLDEIKIHIDSFQPEKQRQSMGIEIQQVLTSIKLAQAYPHLKLIANHPLVDVQDTVDFVRQARNLDINCKIIEAFQFGLAPSVNWAQLDYVQQSSAVWLHKNGKHQIFTKKCGVKHNQNGTLFVGADGVRWAIDLPAIGLPEDFELGWLVH